MALKTDRASRNLAALERTGSTSRVLNLLAVARTYGSEPQYSAAPFFQDKTLNRSIILKHRLRADEIDLFDDAPHTGTKVIVPFAGADLKLGGRSVFVGQRGWTEVLRDVCGAMPEFDKDVRMLECLDALPSLDPFLLREQLKKHGYTAAQCYFALSPADLVKMQSFVASQISELINMAYSSTGASSSNYTAKLVDALLSTEVDERLEPLRRTLRLEGDAYREGVFSWRGFLYYKWVLNTLQPDLKRVLQEMSQLSISGPPDPDSIKYIEAARDRLRRNIIVQMRQIAESLHVYDEAFRALTVKGDPQGFVQFLHRAPTMFIDLGEKIGVASHIASFWRYRFPVGVRARAPMEEAAEIFKDFELGLGIGLGLAA